MDKQQKIIHRYKALHTNPTPFLVADITHKYAHEIERLRADAKKREKDTTDMIHYLEQEVKRKVSHMLSILSTLGIRPLPDYALFVDILILSFRKDTANAKLKKHLKELEQVHYDTRHKPARISTSQHTTQRAHRILCFHRPVKQETMTLKCL